MKSEKKEDNVAFSVAVNLLNAELSKRNRELDDLDSKNPDLALSFKEIEMHLKLKQDSLFNKMLLLQDLNSHVSNNESMLITKISNLEKQKALFEAKQKQFQKESLELEKDIKGLKSEISNSENELKQLSLKKNKTIRETEFVEKELVELNLSKEKSKFQLKEKQSEYSEFEAKYDAIKHAVKVNQEEYKKITQRIEGAESHLLAIEAYSKKKKFELAEKERKSKRAQSLVGIGFGMPEMKTDDNTAFRSNAPENENIIERQITLIKNCIFAKDAGKITEGYDTLSKMYNLLREEQKTVFYPRILRLIKEIEEGLKENH